ncbi:MAG: class I SAM-dependent methyltransferase [Candidatus Auribacterota bacterium]|jgi:SAM-dependent methyltransferase|nr:class I SAM-dependent methyltransferase [Candidatus Auribacterota bacterium]
MEHALYDEMFSNETRHWWFLGRRKIVLSILLRYFRSSTDDIASLKVLDVGCGCGANLAAVSRICDATGIEPSFEGIAYCRKRRLHVTKGALPEKLSVPKNYFDAVLLIDVLEHIDDDKASICAILDVLKPGGIILVTVPAYQWLYTGRDKMHHHKRRYNRRQIHEVVASQGFAREILSYYNFWLFPFALMERLSKKLFATDTPKPDVTVPPALINHIMRLIFQSERFLLQYVVLPFGLSLIGVYRKPS